jgi:divalent metal cation (Fe/Co/Zn/Cd) transporter
LSSVFYAVFLTTFKLIIGLLTNSLGILAEVAHSGLDLVAAAATYFAVRASDKPADKEHPSAMPKSKTFPPYLKL